MDIYALLSLLGGLAFFLSGMTTLSTALKRVAGDRLEVMLKKLTASPITGLMVGAGLTIAMQSSSALTVMLVGLVNSGIMELSQTVGLIMGSNIGTTLTAWILGLSGVESSMPLINLLKPANLAPIAAVIGIVFIMAAKDQKKKDLGTILVGFALLMYGMKQMSDTMAPLADNPKFMKLLVSFENPIMGVVVGTLFTGIIQSSAASVGILQALAITGQVSYAMAIPVVMGQNIGTCVTSLISSIGVSKNAKRVSIIHISFNLIGTALGLTVFFIARYLLNMTFFDDAITPFMVAGVHTVFNVATTIVLLPFSRHLVLISERMFTDEADEAAEFLDERLLNTPTIAVEECKRKSRIILNDTIEACIGSLSLVFGYDSELYEKTKNICVDTSEKIAACESFLGRLYENPYLYNGEQVASLMYNSSDMSRILDYARALQRNADKIEKNKVTLTKRQAGFLTNLKEDYINFLERVRAAYQKDDAVEFEYVLNEAESLISRIKKIRKKLFKKEKEKGFDRQSRLYISEVLFDCNNISWHIANLIESITKVQDAE